ncbi:hypothetical protein [Pseudomonas syringae group sp. J254-4]|uniref:hypothetical protein n=1 Tax=Pseudomonas syringae group sp. J254-4 TaxID=3079589 RepID=UPI00290F7C37|nr:hypothetical protein [Pseudomonas syringae group sp. J254-4]MDU8454837.1 hypothetical protein [Pseudomonas syringae group sp. J254-4]
MTVNIEKLEALAKAATKGPWFSGGTWVSTERGNSVADCARGDEKFIAAANPTAVLELIQRIANLELCQTASLGVSGIIKSAASELGFDAVGEDSALDYLIGLARSAAALRAECEALRKDAQRYRWIENPFAGLFGVESMDKYIDAAMSKEAAQ